MEGITIGFVLSGILIGLAIGFVLQRGRFCMNTAFRDTIFIQDQTLFRAYLIALVIMILGANGLKDMGAMDLFPQPFWPVANILGGYLFGLGMVLAGGCGSGVWYKLGEGQFNAVVAITGFFVGIGATTNGILNPVYKAIRGIGVADGNFSVPIAGETFPTLYNVIGSSAGIKWGIIAAVVIGLTIYIFKENPLKVKKPNKGYAWPLTGVLVGLIGIIAFWASHVWEGFPRGLSFTTPTGEIFFTILTGNANAKIFPMYDLGPFKITWASLYIIAVPLGAYISAKMLKEFKWKVPPVDELLTVFGGSLLMGFGAVLGGGCNVGQALTGASTLSIGSILAAVFIILGNWTMVYFKFIKPMNDMDLD
ncbi:MAG: YeeE/YedE family protein [Nitrospira sp.]|nr:YeeE/YedE family protein [Nitrospira sp.]